MSAEKYTYHLGVYSKLLRGNNRAGPIKQGTEARLIGKSKDFPTHLVMVCQPSTFFANQPGIATIDPRTNKLGVFVYQPIYLNNKHYSLFARLQARPEGGEGVPSRNFSHTAMIAVEDKWEPGLILWAARMLFTSEIGARCWGDSIPERQEDRLEIDLPPLDQSYTRLPETNPAGIALGGRAFSVVKSMPEDTERQNFNDIALAIAGDLNREGYATHGRWLNFAVGSSTKVEGHEPGFFLRIFGTPEELVEKQQSLKFEDAIPPHLNNNDSLSNSNPEQRIDWRFLGPASHSGIQRLNLLKTENFWPDQYDSSGIEIQLPEPEVARKAAIIRPTAPNNNAGFGVRGRGENLAAHEEQQIPDEVDRNIAALTRPASTPVIDSSEGYGLHARLEPPFYYSPDFEILFSESNQARSVAGVRYLVGRANLITKYTPEYEFNGNDIVALNGVWHIIRMVAAYCVAGDPAIAKDYLNRLFNMEDVEWLPDEINHNGGIAAIVLGNFITAVGKHEIVDWITRCGKSERDLLRFKQLEGSVDRGAFAYSQKPQLIQLLFDELTDVPLLPEGMCSRVFHNAWTPRLDEKAGELRQAFTYSDS